MFVANLPEYYTNQDLIYFFSELDLDVVSANIHEGCCSGIVTFESMDQAQRTLDFQEHQPFILEDREIVVSWAKPSDFAEEEPDGRGHPAYVDPHSYHPRMRDARATASRVAAQISEHNMGNIDEQMDPRDARRNVVQYDDL